MQDVEVGVGADDGGTAGVDDRPRHSVAVRGRSLVGVGVVETDVVVAPHAVEALRRREDAALVLAAEGEARPVVAPVVVRVVVLVPGQPIDDVQRVAEVHRVGVGAVVGARGGVRAVAWCHEVPVVAVLIGTAGVVLVAVVVAVVGRPAVVARRVVRVQPVTVIRVVAVSHFRSLVVTGHLLASGVHGEVGEATACVQRDARSVVDTVVLAGRVVVQRVDVAARVDGVEPVLDVVVRGRQIADVHVVGRPAATRS